MINVVAGLGRKRTKSKKAVKGYREWVGGKLLDARPNAKPFSFQVSVSKGEEVWWPLSWSCRALDEGLVAGSDARDCSLITPNRVPVAGDPPIAVANGSPAWQHLNSTLAPAVPP